MLDGYTYRVDIQHSVQERLDHMIASHCKVLSVRFDVRFPNVYPHDGGNQALSRFMKALKEFYTGHGVMIHYVWVREQVSSEVPHYHVVLFVNGSCIQDARGIWCKAQEVWSRIVGGLDGLVQFCWPWYQDHTGVGGIMIRRPAGNAVGYQLLAQEQAFAAARLAALEHAAYLAKEYSKGNAPERVREFGASQL